MSESAGARGTWPIFVCLGIGTFFYVLIFFILVGFTESCPGEAWVWSNPLSPLRAYLSCRSINELGDALAGAFAPVAFVWLAGAVVLQSKELAEQRRELALTREEIKQQVNESRATTAYIGEQTEILRAEQKLRETAEADATLVEALSALEQTIKISSPVTLRVVYARTGATQSFDWNPSFMKGLAEALQDIAQLSHHLRLTLERSKPEPCRLSEWDRTAFKSILEQMKVVAIHSANVSQGMHVKLRVLKLDERIPLLEELFDRCEASKAGTIR